MEGKSLEVIRTEFACNADNHRLFALELLGREASTSADITIALACTSCGTLILHRIKV